MFERLQAVEDRYDHLNELLSDPDIVSDMTKLRIIRRSSPDCKKQWKRTVNIKVLAEQ